MHQGRLKTLTSAADEVEESYINVGPIERWLSVAGAAALLAIGARRKNAPLLIGGGVLLFRGVIGFCPVYEALKSRRSELEIEKTISVFRPVNEVYAVWRNLENLPRFMSHLESVTVIDDKRSRWVAQLPRPLRLEWDAAITEEHENESLSWASLPDSDVAHAGSVYFRSVPGRNATEVRVTLSYRPPAGAAGAAVGRFLSTITEDQIREDLRCFKAIVEAGERPTTAGQPTGVTLH
jgi:uncharacterized membrane protein